MAETTPSRPRKRLRQRAREQRRWAALILLAFLVAAGAVGLVGMKLMRVYRASVPVLLSSAASDPSPILRLRLRNPSALFKLVDVELSCGVQRVTFAAGAGSPTAFEGYAEVYRRQAVMVPAQSAVDFPCDAANIVRSYRARVAAADPHLAELQLWVGVHYRVGLFLFAWGGQEMPSYFTWTAPPNGPKWHQG